MDNVSAIATISLPRGIEASDLVALIDQLEARAKAVTQAHTTRAHHGDDHGIPHVGQLPAGIHVSLTRLTRHRDELRAANRERDAAPGVPTDNSAMATTNAASDGGWRAFESWSSGWSQLEDDGTPDVGAMRALHTRVFPADVGMRFIGWRPRKQWEAMGQRMDLLEAPAARDVIHALGGKRFLDYLRATHDAFGRAYGFTRATAPEASATTDTRPQWLAAQDALRDYVRKVSAHADPEVEQSETLAEYLLGPFNQMVSEFAQRPAPKTGKKPGAGDAPATP